jgi:Spy/CpxP family protein refolding chaperone
LLNDEQKTRYNELSSDYQKNFKRLENEQTAAFNKAVEQTNKILTAEQQRKYQQILNDRVGHGQRPDSMVDPTFGSPGPSTRQTR